jgi:acetyltransferase-like isoleucine patch superfamily enzyme
MSVSKQFEVLTTDSMKPSEYIVRVRKRLKRHSVWAHIKGLWFARKFTRAGIIVVSGGLPIPKIINEGGEIYAENCQFYSGVRLEVGDNAILRIGNGTYINRNTVVVANKLVDIGRNCRISWDVVIMDSDLHPIPGQDMEDKPIIIEDDVWIGCRSILLKGIRVCTGAVIAAGAVVTKDVPPFTIVGGVPARVLHELKPING